MSSISSGNAQQYGDSRKLAARARLHKKYTIAETGWFPWIASQLPLRTGDRVLDVGCGPAWFWATLADTLPEKLELTLADLSSGMVQEAVERCKALPFVSVIGEQADAAALPFADGTFDAVIAMHMLYHVTNPAHGIMEMFRVLKPGGFLAVTTNGANNMREIYEFTTVFGSTPSDPASVAFGYETAERLMRSHFGNVTMSQHPAHLQISEPDDVFQALTSYPPGESASASQREALREAIEQAFRRGNGVLEVQKEMGLFLSRKMG
jgi:ubiquinone/menaquinone biosynthesis C-methylase UbiE